MIKVLHTADWHLGKKLGHIDRLEEQRLVLEELVVLAEREAVDVVLIAGDLWDTFVPAHDALALFYSTVSRLSRGGKCAVIAIAGNHDSPDRVKAPATLAAESGVFLLGYPEETPVSVALPDGIKTLQTGPGWLQLGFPGTTETFCCICTPYANELRLQQWLGKDEGEKSRQLGDWLAQQWQRLMDTIPASDVTVLMTHAYASADGRAEEELENADAERPIVHVGGAPALLPEQFPAAVDYVALGHLHRGHAVQASAPHVRYSGSPLALSFAEAGHEKSVCIVTFSQGHVPDIQLHPVRSARPLLRHRSNDLSEALQWLTAHTHAIAELSLESDTYLTANQLLPLHQAHSDLFLVPVVRAESTVEQDDLEPDIQQDISTLFNSYVLATRGQEAGPELIAIFKEVLAEPENEVL
jgi:exonuclease SbcD